MIQNCFFQHKSLPRSLVTQLAVFLVVSFACLNSSAETAVERGAYLTNILGCGGCHTEGALLGNPTGQWLAGSRIGIAYTEDLDDVSPGKG